MILPNEKFAQLASEESIKRAVENLKKNNIRVLVMGNGKAAKEEVNKILPLGSEVMNMTSTTLMSLGIDKEILDSGRWKPVRKILATLEEKDNVEKQKIGAAPEYVIGSVHAVTENGEVLIASQTGSQLPAYAYGSIHVIWVVGTQKIVKDTEEGIKRIYEYSYPLENERAMKAYGTGSSVNKILIINNEIKPDRITLIFVKEKLGF